VVSAQVGQGDDVDTLSIIVHAIYARMRGAKGIDYEGEPPTLFELNFIMGILGMDVRRKAA